MKKATRSILSAAVAVSMAATACPVSFAATTSNEVTAREKANAALAREAAAQGMVLLENKNNSLPIKTKKLALFGGGAVRTVRGGTGSGDPFNGGLSGGGDVNVNQSERYNINIYNSFKKAGYDITTASILEKYAEGYDVENAKAASNPMATFAYPELTFTDEELAASAKDTNTAVYVISRNAGEGADRGMTKKVTVNEVEYELGDYELSDVEKENLKKVASAFENTIVVLNVGGVIDTKFFEETEGLDSLLLMGQGGQEGGNGVADVLMGRVNPCGKLTDTIAENIEDYPSQSCFGDLTRNEYKEDIYVGYRYFETFAKEKVLYPFGFGLSYTTFAVTAEAEEKDVDNVTVTATVENTGKTDGKEVVQVYVKAPQGVLGKPSRALVGFAKIGVLAPGAKETLTIDVTKESFASYDDSGATGHKSCYVLEEGSYEFYVGSDVRSAAFAGAYEQPFKVVEILTEAMAPVEAFERMKAVPGEDGTLKPGYEAAPLRTVDPIERMKENRMEPITYTGDKGYKLGDVLDKKVTMEEFVAQLSDEDLICIFRGEGMCSPKATPGTAAAFGGLTPELQEFGIPAACCTDGPSGLRFDCGTRAFSMPNGTLLGCTFALPLVEDLYEMAGREMRQNRVDALLGPGMNIHRNPLNGRNFEYISEDPYLTGWISAVQILGMEKSDVTGTIKHFCANNQESNRHHVDAVVSERALREIYLKGYEIAVKEGGARSIMSTYGPVNGIWTAGNYDLLTTILRGEWNYDGFDMTD